MTVTISDIAEKANVSIATVSRALNGKEGISPETREKILLIASQLGYNLRKLKKKQTKIVNIGVIFDKRLNSLERDPFYSSVLEGLEESLQKYDYHIFFKTISGKIKKDIMEIKDIINEKELAGLIIVGNKINKRAITEIKNRSIPLVLVDNDLWDENIDCVVNDNIAGAKRIVSSIIKAGHQKIGFIGGPLSHVSLEERYIGYKQALKENGLEKDNKLIYFCSPTFNVEDGYNAAMKILQDKNLKLTAFFAANDMLAIGVGRAIEKSGYNLPEDISIAGFDDIQMAKYMTPALTTVKTFKKEMGNLAGRRLNELIRGINIKPIKLVVSVEKVIRDSVKIITD